MAESAPASLRGESDEQARVRSQARQQAAVAEIGLFALETRDLQSVMECAVQIVATTLELEHVAVLERSMSAQELWLRATTEPETTWLPEAHVPLREGTPLEAALRSRAPVVVEGGLQRAGFTEWGLGSGEGFMSGLTVPLRAPGGRPFGVLTARSRNARRFGSDHVHFTQAVANVIAAAVARRQMETRLATVEQEAHEEREQAGRAREALQQRDEFLAVAAHELRTPVSGLALKLQGLEQLLLGGASRGAATTGSAPAVLTRTRDAVRHTERLSRLVERLLDVSHLVQGQLELRPRLCDLAELASSVARELADQADEAGSELRAIAEAPVLGCWDEGRLRQVVRNLLANALKYGRGQPVTLEIRASAGLAELRVTDRGIGIAPENLDRIFARFERAAPLRHYGGFGLGLYITRQLVEAHQGSIHVTSELGSGATFVVRLPLPPSPRLQP